MGVTCLMCVSCGVAGYGVGQGKGAVGLAVCGGVVMVVGFTRLGFWGDAGQERA
jgi:hypothetical protein